VHNSSNCQLCGKAVTQTKSKPICTSPHFSSICMRDRHLLSIWVRSGNGLGRPHYHTRWSPSADSIEWSVCQRPVLVSRLLAGGADLCAAEEGTGFPLSDAPWLAFLVQQGNHPTTCVSDLTIIFSASLPFAHVVFFHSSSYRSASSVPFYPQSFFSASVSYYSLVHDLDPLSVRFAIIKHYVLSGDRALRCLPVGFLLNHFDIKD
jgi:hypothetical protein